MKKKFFFLWMYQKKFFDTYQKKGQSSRIVTISEPNFLNIFLDGFGDLELDAADTDDGARPTGTIISAMSATEQRLDPRRPIVGDGSGDRDATPGRFSIPKCIPAVVA